MAEHSGSTVHGPDVITPIETAGWLMNRSAPFVGFQMAEKRCIEAVSVGGQQLVSNRIKGFQWAEPHKRTITSSWKRLRFAPPQYRP